MLTCRLSGWLELHYFPPGLSTTEGTFTSVSSGNLHARVLRPNNNSHNEPDSLPTVVIISGIQFWNLGSLKVVMSTRFFFVFVGFVFRIFLATSPIFVFCHGVRERNANGDQD